MNRDIQVTIDRTSGDEAVNDLIKRKFVVVVRVHRDGKRTIRYAPGAQEWFEAAAAYTMAHNANTLTEAHRRQIRAAWRALDGEVRWSDAERAFLAETFSVQ
jgi:hypothetical protein